MSTCENDMVKCENNNMGKYDQKGRGMSKRMRAGLLSLILALGLSFTNGYALAKESRKQDAKLEIQADNKQVKQKDGKREHADEQAPTVNLTTPADNTASLYPAAFNLEATVTFPGKAVGHNDKREGIEVEFLADGKKFAEAKHAPYRASYVPAQAGIHILTARIHYGEGKRFIDSNTINVISDLPPSVALTTPANNTVQTAPASFTLTANASAPIGTIAQVDYYANGILIGTATSTPYSFNWNNVPYGSYSITAKATDNWGISNTSTAITVISNAAPSVSITAPAANTVQTAPTSFTLTASASDADGSITKVDLYADGVLIGTATAAPYSISWPNVPAGNYTLTAVATDNYGAQTTSGGVAVISNAAPAVSIASPASNAVVAASGSFILTANASDSDGTIAKVDYYANGTLIGTTTAAPYSYTWNSIPAGIYNLTAIATDNYGASTTSSAISVISDTPPAVSLTGPANNAVQTAPASFTLTASASSSMSTIARVEFYNGQTLLGTATSAPYSFNWSNVAAGSYTLTAKAVDGYGIANTSAAITVVANAAPMVSLTSPAANAIQTTPASFTLTADATDTDGSIAKVEFYANDGTTNTLIGTVTQAPYTFNWSNVAAGSYNLTAIATDNHGAATTSSAVAVTSNAAPSVTLTGPAAGSQITSPNSFTLTADATDSDGSIAKVEFYANDGTANTLIGTSTQAPYSLTWPNVPVGSYSLTAIATDNLGGQSTSAAVAVIAIANVPPTVSLTSPANGATATVPGSFTLTADAASTTSAVAKVDFYAIDNVSNASTLIGTSTQSPYSTTWSNVPVGSYTLSAVATDTLNAITTSAAVSVTVKTGVAQVYYIHTDHLDTPREITDVNGSTVWLWDNSDPFGNNAANENPNGTGQFSFPLRFPGQYADKETNTNYNINRDYDPAIGRYIESDPIGLLGGLNTYAYVGGGPLQWTDIWGLSAVLINIQRGSATSNSTPGRITVNGQPLGYSLELPDRNNQNNISRIPTGSYTARVRYSNKWKRDVLELIGVPNRDHIEMHIGNFPEDTHGCILPGKKQVTDAVLDSGKAFDEIMNMINITRNLDRQTGEPTDIVVNIRGSK